MSPDLRERLHAGCAALHLSLSPEQEQRLLNYLALLGKWNRVYNLTAVRDGEDMLTHHLLDSLAVVPPLRRALSACRSTPPRVLDVGSGGGLPGVVMAIACPDVTVTCVDTVAKKAAFIQQAAAELGLPNLSAIHARVENLREAYDVVTSRAFASLKDFVAGSRQALTPGGVWMAMKGRQPDAEIAELPAGIAAFHVEPVTVPGLDAQRCIVWMRG